MSPTGQTVISIGNRQAEIDVCGHEEADTKISSHVLDALKAGRKTILVKTVDTDVVIILLGLFHSLSTQFCDADIWIAFGQKKYFRYYHINTLYEAWGERKCRSLPFFHAFTGSDTTSQFFRHGKKSAWHAWTCFPDVTEALLVPSEEPFIHIEIASSLFGLMERFVCLMYDSSSPLLSVNDMRRELFAKRGKSMDFLPPTLVKFTKHT